MTVTKYLPGQQFYISISKLTFSNNAPMTSLLLSLLLNPKSLKSYSTAPTSNPTRIPSLLGFSALLVPTVTNIVNLSLSSRNHTLKECVIPPLLKKPTLNKDELSNYRPISNLSLLSKITERVVKACLL